jgi:nitrite reductase/ring-hydroxylating ferredoxin subunit
VSDPRHGVCLSAALADGGRGVRFARKPSAEGEDAFAIRHRGIAYAYVNRCPHMGTELDWQPGEFLEESGLYLVCATHGALFEPATGLCVAGPCRGASLERVPITEEGGEVLMAKAMPGAIR